MIGRIAINAIAIWIAVDGIVAAAEFTFEFELVARYWIFVTIWFNRFCTL